MAKKIKTIKVTLRPIGKVIDRTIEQIERASGRAGISVADRSRAKKKIKALRAIKKTVQAECRQEPWINRFPGRAGASTRRK